MCLSSSRYQGEKGRKKGGSAGDGQTDLRFAVPFIGFTSLRLSISEGMSGRNQYSDHLWKSYIVMDVNSLKEKVPGIVPTICRFYGILIQMYYDDHNPPHFHAIYGDYKAVISIRDFALLEGDLPPKAWGLVMEWAKYHKNELLNEWDLATNKQPLFQIEPLE